MQSLPGEQSPHDTGDPQPSSIVPHCALTLGQSTGRQQTPNLSSGFWRTHRRLAQLRLTWHDAPSRLPPARAVVARPLTRIQVATETMAAVFMICSALPHFVGLCLEILTPWTDRQDGRASPCFC
jgi:hypothetical protein